MTIIVPARNEGHTIEPSLAAALAQDYPPDLFEVLVADGQSGDATREKVLNTAECDPRVRLIENQGRIASSGLNTALLRRVLLSQIGCGELSYGFVAFGTFELLKISLDCLSVILLSEEEQFFRTAHEYFGKWPQTF